MSSDDWKKELDRQIECVVSRIRSLAASKNRGGLTVHFDGSGLLGRNFTEHFSVSRDDFSPVKVARKIDEDELDEILTRRKS